jgi:hypothetical protein
MKPLPSMHPSRSLPQKFTTKSKPVRYPTMCNLCLQKFSSGGSEREEAASVSDDKIQQVLQGSSQMPAAVHAHGNGPIGGLSTARQGHAEHPQATPKRIARSSSKERDIEHQASHPKLQNDSHAEQLRTQSRKHQRTHSTLWKECTRSIEAREKDGMPPFRPQLMTNGASCEWRVPLSFSKLTEFRGDIRSVHQLPEPLCTGMPGLPATQWCW